MARDVIITPASGLIDFQGSVGVSSATIELDTSGNLNIANPGGDLTLGDTSRDVYIGNGVANVDIIFEQDGEIRGLTGKTITLGQSDSFVAFAGTVTGDVTFTGKLVFPDNGTVPDDPTNEQYDYMTFGANGSISQVSGRGALMITSSDDSLILACGDVGKSFTSSNIDADSENLFLFSDSSVTVKTDLQNGFGSANTYTFLGGVITSPRFTSTQATGTAPFTVSSTTVVTNLNADTVDGIQASSFLRSDADDTTTGQIQITKANNTATGGGQLYLNGATGNRIDFNQNGVAAPAFTTRSVGTKIVLYPNVSASNVDYALGIEGSTLWSSIPAATNSYQHRWYAGTTQLADLKGSGELVIGSTSLTGTASQSLQVNGGAYVSGNLGIGNTNPTAKLDVNGTLNVSGVSTFQGNVNLGDNDALQIGDSADLKLFHNGSHSFVEDNGVGSLYLRSGVGGVFITKTTGDQMIAANPDGTVELYHNAVKKFETTADGVTVTGNVTADGLRLGDSEYAYFGNGNDLQIYHDGSDSFVREGGTGELRLASDNAVRIRKDNNETMALFTADGAAALYYDNSKKFETTGYGVTVSGGIYVSGISTFQGGIHDGTSLGTSGQVLSSTGTGLSWIDAAAGGGGGGSGTFDTGITTSIYVSVTSGVGTNVSTTNDIFVGPDTSYTFPSTAGKKYVIESIHITNTFANELYFVGRHDFNGGSNVPLAQRVIVPYQGATEFLDQPIIANPSDILRFQALTGTGSTATGINAGLDAFIVYSTKDDTNYIGTGKTVTTAAGTEIFQASSNPAMLQSIKLCNYSLNSDIDASISIYNGGLSSGTRLGYLVYNLTVPKNSVIEILEKPKYLATNAAIVGGASAANVLGVTLSGKYIT